MAAGGTTTHHHRRRTARRVSKGLVSLALNDRPGVNADTRARIRSAADDIGWRPNAAARSLTSRRTSALGLVVKRDPSIIETDPFFAAFIAGLEAVLSERGQVLVLSVVADADAEERSYRTLAGDGRVDGFIITDLRRADPRVALVAGLGSVAVTLGEPDVPSDFPAVRREYERGIDDLVRYLADLGHTRIAHVAGNDDMLHGQARRQQFERTAHALGVQASVAPTDFSPEAGAAATEALLGRARSSAPPRSSTATTPWPSRAWRSRSASASACRTTSRSPASTARRSAGTCTRPSPRSTTIRRSGDASSRPPSSTSSTARTPSTAHSPRRASSSGVPPGHRPEPGLTGSTTDPNAAPTKESACNAA
ncbi:substrate-binding domain-containing protein [Curtobacterium flaccumfaciens]|nr:substrate-binding domain-containing protein [Curtobacterium flaccumfaciens]